MSDRYILDGHEPVACPSLFAWARWLESANRHVAQTFIPGGIWVSTVFLGLDHGFGWYARPMLFETMVFKDLPEPREMFGHMISRDALEDYTRRYATWDQALLGHQEVVDEIMAIHDSSSPPSTEPTPSDETPPPPTCPSSAGAGNGGSALSRSWSHAYR